MAGWRVPRGGLPLGGLLLGQAIPGDVPRLGLLLALGLVPLALGRRRTASPAALLLALLAGILAAPGVPAPCPREDPVWMAGPVTRWETRGDSVVVALEAWRVGERGIASPFPVRSAGPVSWGVVPPARFVALRGRWRPDRGPTNPGQAPGSGGGFLRAEGPPAAGPGAPPLLARVRHAVTDRLRARLDAPTAALAEGMLLGRSRALDRTDREAFRRTGTLHLLAVSGLHVGLAALLAATLCAGADVRVRWIAGALAAIAFAGFSGGSPSAVRAAGLAGLLAAGRLAGRPAPLPGLLLPLLAGILAADPEAAGRLGLQLSFLAVGGILFALDVTRLRGRARVLMPLVVSLGAQGGTVALQVSAFGTLAPAALLPNLVLVPLAAAFLPAILLALLADPLAACSGWLWTGAEGGGHLLLAVARHAARHGPFLEHVVRPPSGTTWLVPLGLLLWFGLPGTVRARRRARILALVAGVLVVAAPLAPWPAPRGPWVAFLDVGQGDASVVRLSDGAVWVVDVGDDRGGDAGLRVVRPFLRAMRVRRVDAVVLTHRHRDHVGGLAALLAAVPVARVVDAGHGDGVTARRVEGLLTHHGIPRTVPEPGDTLHAGPGCSVVALHPSGEASALAGNLNDVSVVLRVTDGPLSVLFAGDLERPGEAALLARGTSPGSDGLQVGHHGSDTSTGPAFLEAVAPRWAVVSAGADNRYGHPSPETLRRLRDAGVRVYRTDRDGAILAWGRGDSLAFRVHPPGSGVAVVAP